MQVPVAEQAVHRFDVMLLTGRAGDGRADFSWVWYGSSEMALASGMSVPLIGAACSSHGGLDAWSKVRSLEGRFSRLGGPIPIFKGIGATFEMPTAFSVHPHERKTVFHDYPRLGRTTVFDGTTAPVRMLVFTQDGERAELTDYRRRFRGIGKWRRWNSTDAAYFFGYALLTYFSVPFLLKDCEVLRARKDAVTVRLPLMFESHCEVQTFWFDSNGLIVRHDYSAEILGKVFSGAHYSSDFAEVQGLKLARARRVVPRLGLLPLPLTMLSATLSFGSPQQPPTSRSLGGAG